ncbi:MAG: hypothetical protein AAFX06_11055 [Planctomycetota bacterium]
MSRLNVSGILLAAAAVLLVGCSAEVTPTPTTTATNTSSKPAAQPVSAEVKALRLDAMPEGDVHSPTDIKDAEGEAVEGILAGRIANGDADPFRPGQLFFMLSQLPDEGHSDDPDHADNCPFCARKLKNAPKAMVTFVGEDGIAITGDAQQGLGLSEGDVVYVLGSAEYNSDVNTVLVQASGIFTESPE